MSPLIRLRVRSHLLPPGEGFWSRLVVRLRLVARLNKCSVFVTRSVSEAEFRGGDSADSSLTLRVTFSNGRSQRDCVRTVATPDPVRRCDVVLPC